MEYRQLGKEELDVLLKSPKYYPVKFDPEKNEIVSIEIDELTFRQQAFHDRRLLTNDSVYYRMPTDIVLSRHRKALKTIPRLNYIFHSAFCGSTLLSRYLGELQKVFVYREPPLLSDLATLKHLRFAKTSKKTYLDLLRLSTRLMSRTFDDDVPLTKLNDDSNNVISDLQKIGTNMRLMVIYSDLESFLLSTLKNNDRRAFVRRRLQFFNRYPFPALRALDVESLSDGQASACLWAVQMSYLQQATKSKKNSLVSLNCDCLFSRPVDTLRSVAAFFDFPFNDEDIAKAIDLHSNTHSKSGGTFTELARQREKEMLRDLHREELLDAINWCEPMLNSRSIPNELSNPLL